MRIENHTGTLCPALGGWGEGRGGRQAAPSVLGKHQTAAPFSTNKAKGPSARAEEEEGKGRAGVCQQISLDQNKLFQETAVNRTWVLGGVGWRGARPTPSGQGPHLPGNPLRGSGLEGEEQGGAPWATPRFQGQGSGSVLAHGHGRLPSPSCATVSSALLSPNTHQPREGPRFQAAPDEERRGWGGWYFRFTPRAGQGQCCSRHSMCQNSTPSPTGPVPVLWPRAPGLSPHRDPQPGRLGAVRPCEPGGPAVSPGLSEQTAQSPVLAAGQALPACVPLSSSCSTTACTHASPQRPPMPDRELGSAAPPPTPA